MQPKTPKRAVDDSVRVARVDQGLRAVLIRIDDNRNALARVTEHDAAYVSGPSP